MTNAQFLDRLARLQETLQISERRYLVRNHRYAIRILANLIKSRRLAGGQGFPFRVLRRALLDHDPRSIRLVDWGAQLQGAVEELRRDHPDLFPPVRKSDM